MGPEMFVLQAPQSEQLSLICIDGPVCSLKLGWQNMIVLSSPQAVKDLIEKKSNLYSARPDLYINEVTLGHNIILRR